MKKESYEKLEMEVLDFGMNKILMDDAGSEIPDTDDEWEE